jgi:DNA topoisomerase-6 subunit B
LKTDEALGKTGAGPEGLPNSIIVTPEGIEGEVPIAEEVTASVGDEGMDTPHIAASSDPVEREKRQTAENESKTAHRAPAHKPESGNKTSKRKADQLPLFAESTSPGKKAAGRAGSPATDKPKRARGAGKQ